MTESGPLAAVNDAPDDNVVLINDDRRIASMMASPNVSVARLGRLLHTGAAAGIAKFVADERARGTHPQMIGHSLANLFGAAVGGVATVYEPGGIGPALREMLDGIIDAAAIVVAAERPDVPPPMQRPAPRA